MQWVFGAHTLQIKWINIASAGDVDGMNAAFNFLFPEMQESAQSREVW